LAATSLPDPAGEDAELLAALVVQPRDEFPAIALQGLDGEQTNFSAFRRADRSYLINLWATHCGPCLREMPELAALAPSLAANGIEVVGISLDMGAAKAKVPSFARRLGVNYPLFTTEEHVFSQIFSGDQVFIPLSFFVDREGMVKDVMAGWSEETAAKIRTWSGDKSPLTKGTQ
jgi:thiol-disulfide isomerase/thioredoxin